MWWSLAFAAPFVVTQEPTARFVTEDDCATGCAQVCHLDEGGAGVLCLPAAEASARESAYGCEAACDGSCARTHHGITCFPGGIEGYARAAVRLRAAPSTTSPVVRTLEAGTPIPAMARQGDWVRSDDGWVHADLVGPTWVGPPEPADGYGLVGWPVARVGDDLVEVVDWGHQGAVDGPLFVLCRTPLAGGETRCWKPPEASTDPAPGPHLAYLWNQHGSAVQGFLAGGQPVGQRAVTEAEAGLTVARDPHGITAVRRGSEVLWSPPDPDGTRGHLRGLHRVDQYLLLALVVRPLGGCCDEAVGLALPWAP